MIKLWRILAGIAVLVFYGCYIVLAAAEGAVPMLIHGGLVVCAIVLIWKDTYGCPLTKRLHKNGLFGRKGMPYLSEENYAKINGTKTKNPLPDEDTPLTDRRSASGVDGGAYRKAC